MEDTTMTKEKAERVHRMYASLTVASVNAGDITGARAYAAMADRVSPFGADVEAGPAEHCWYPEPIEPSAEWDALATAIDGEPSPDESITALYGDGTDDPHADCEFCTTLYVGRHRFL